ncbi:MAG: 2-C-methyl-D-erythritol 4-phosphate cytidylyltransferase [Propionicimonas sp.]|uniref:2-C-methyl-D-erythritol 4-phosphate cytidylyltransferase n=1 Tax=Propionicimonas sp. TaxID=1955623 RepID=UPI002B20436B|nr:2-C-methyl-D-erythritol 4-phosphate cytidylyltransferase [Propionicimonas sp.]MEA4945081.1 2-C-methyl-D-erythritol 4-phosphate cytidylyltransferase [Propionicimonas sp.]MEA5053641.1 2-C-methyl-D-erythritol 4-phosphate cytidylyltransferase [Propionicimonas sp.]MEA5117819.1 2-C-methyl-D-erythritol 4-phosphate cytidylyltransferase [Propionicimonas sp.]
MSEPVVAIVVAAGAGSRLGGEVAKALRTVGGRTLVSRSVEALAAGGVTDAVVVAPAALQEEFVFELADAIIPVLVVPGGRERQDSVRHGLEAIDAAAELAGSRFVLVHDAARALVPPQVTAGVIAALQAGAVGCVPVVPVVDTIRQLTPDGSRVVDRADLRAVQTPQGFERAVLVEAHRRLAGSGTVVTDDAAAVEALGHEIVLVAGHRDALKITEPQDLQFAEAIAAGRR